MKEVCGFKSLDGKFHDTKSDCERADIEHRMHSIRNTLDSFYNEIDNSIFREYSFKGKLQQTWNYERESIMTAVARNVLLYSDDFIKIINRKKELEKDLDKLQKQRDSWWLKVKWW